MSQEAQSIAVEEKNDPDKERASRPGRRGDGGIYLVIGDDSDEFAISLRYAARMAKNNRAHVGILHVIDLEGFVHWSNVEQKMRVEMRKDAEQFLWNTARTVNDLTGQIPALYLLEGSRAESLVEVINGDMQIRMLVLAGKTKAGGPGPLVSYFTGKGLSRMRVPVVVVPDHLSPAKIDEIT